jgi:hypothetical protein
MFWSRDIGFDYLAARAGLEIIASTEPLHCPFGATTTKTSALSFAARCRDSVGLCSWLAAILDRVTRNDPFIYD